MTRTPTQIAVEVVGKYQANQDFTATDMMFAVEEGIKIATGPQAQGQPKPGDYGWIDFAHMESDDDPERFYIEIFSTNDEGFYEDEIAVICHRLVGGKYPLDGEVANDKRANAQRIVDALNSTR